MIRIAPLPRALVPVGDDAARRISAPNYDEFQDDGEVWELIRAAPDSVLRVTMAHCDAPTPEEMLEADSDASLRRAARNMDGLRAADTTRVVSETLFLYDITGRARPGVRQIGLGGFARTDQIRTAANPRGPIIRNEGIREPKARGRARLIEATGAIIGGVNNAVPDADGSFVATLEAMADAHEPDLQCRSADGWLHRIWLVTAADDRERLQDALASQPEAYVADGNHRSAAAAMLGLEHFLAVFFPMGRMAILPYNRLVDGVEPGALSDEALGARFALDRLPPGAAPYQPVPARNGSAPAGSAGMRFGLYRAAEGWSALAPPTGAWDAADAAASIPHAVAQRLLFEEVLGISDARDERIRYVGANRDAGWLAAEVDAGRARAAVTLPPVTMEQFASVCRQGAMMPPKSTWFSPKIRSGLVMALIDP